MHSPSHPGEVLYELYMKPLELKSKDLAEKIGVDRKTISRLINCRTTITIEMALKLGRAFDNAPYIWLNMQQNYDLWQAQKSYAKEMKKIMPFKLEALPV